MANGILRKITVGIAKETTYGVAAASPDFGLLLTELSWDEEITRIENTAMVGGTYELNESKVAFKKLNFTMTAKVDEDVLPLLLLQKFDIASVLTDVTAYTHTLTYNNDNTTTSYTLFWDDPDRGDLIAAGAVFENINFNAQPEGFVTVEISGMAKFPVAGATTVAFTGPREFLGRHTSFEIGDFGGALAAFELLEITGNHSFTLSDDDINFGLGSTDLTKLFTLNDRFELEVSAMFPDYTYYDKWCLGTTQQGKVTITDTNRIITGSSTSPSVELEYPALEIINWERDGGANDILRQNMTLLALDKIGVADAPLKITIINGVASY